MWTTDDPRYIFVQGAKWWQFRANGATAFPSEVDDMEQEAERRFPNGKIPQAITR